MKFAPIILFCYNRRDHLEKVINSLKENQGALDSNLYIYSDGAKNERDIKFVTDLRSYLHTVNGFKKIEIIERDKNLGLAENIISGVTEVINRYGKAIVLEDDLVTSSFFLNYMNYALNFYEFNNEVISIHGYVYPINNLPEFFFLRGADCWGWATWKRGWDLFEKDGKKLLNEIKHQKIEKKFDFNFSYPYTKMLEDQVEGKNNSWAIRWYASAYLKNMYTLYPGSSLVTNIGLDGSGTHCGLNDNYMTLIGNGNSLKFPNEIQDSLVARRLFQKFFKSANGKLLSKILRRIKRFISSRLS